MSDPTEPYEPVDDQTVMRPPRRYGDDGAATPGLSVIHICRCRRLLTCRSRWWP